MMNSLEIAEKHVGEIKKISEHNKEKPENYYSVVKYKELMQIKQDLEKYKKIKELINNLPKHIETTDIFGKHVLTCKKNDNSMQIDRPTQILLLELLKYSEEKGEKHK